jgi:tetratricopeptide (TPR) repeat protein
MAAPAAVLALLAFVAALIGGDERPGWLGWAPSWVLAALAAALAALSTWLVEPWATRRRAQTDREWTIRDQLGRHLGRADRLPRLDEMDPLALGVHRSIPVSADDHTSERPEGLDPRLPAWIERDKAADVRRWLEQAKVDGGFLLLVGDSSTGKTRLLYEVLREQAADWAVLAPDLGDGHLVNAVAEATFRLPPLVVWLDELQRFLAGPYLTEGSGSVSAGALRRLLDAPTPVVVVGAMWPEHVRELRAIDEDLATGRRMPRWPAAADILESDRRTELTLHSVSANERSAAARPAADDPRLAAALADEKFGVTEFLAGAPDLIRRYEQAAEAQRALVHAAVDAVRLGLRPLLTDQVLVATACCYLAGASGADESWYPAARDGLTQLRRGTSVLVVTADATRARGGLAVADYLYQRLARARATVVPPVEFWQLLMHGSSTAAELTRLGDSASARGLGRLAEDFYNRARTTGDPRAHTRLALLMFRQGRGDDLEAIWRDGVAAGDPNSRLRLADMLQDRGEGAEAERILRAGVAVDEPGAAAGLAGLLRREYREAEAEHVLREALTAGHPGCRRELVSLLSGQGRLAEAEEVLREAVAAGEPEARSQLFLWLAGRQGRDREAEQVLREAVAADERDARLGLAMELERQDRLAEAEQAWRDAAAAGDPNAAVVLAKLLETQDRQDEALEVLRRAAAQGDGDALLEAVERLTRKGQNREAERLCRSAVAAGVPYARSGLAAVLGDRGELDEAERVCRDGLAAGEPEGRMTLTQVLLKANREEEAVRVYECRLEPDYFTGS